MLGRALAKATGIHFVDIDDGPASCAPPLEEDPYRSAESREREKSRMSIAYNVLLATIEQNLKQGNSIIVAAAYTRSSYYEFLRGVVGKGGGYLMVIQCRYNDTVDEIERRIAGRLLKGAIGGCRSVSHYLDDRSRYENPSFPHIVVMMEGGEEGLRTALDQAFAYINA